MTQSNMISLGVGQLADSWIALFLLLAFISLRHFDATRNKAFIGMAGGLLGCMLWTKNEGVLLAGGFTLFITGPLLRYRCLGHYVRGVGLPLVAWLVFKVALAPQNDFIALQSGFPWDKISAGWRYEELITQTWDIIKLYYPALPYVLCGYVALCLWERKWPDRYLLMILVFFLVYLSVYIVTPHNIGWHVRTSVDRLLFHLTPAFIWIVAGRLSANGILADTEKGWFKSIASRLHPMIGGRQDK